MVVGVVIVVVGVVVGGVVVDVDGVAFVIVGVGVVAVVEAVLTSATRSSQSILSRAGCAAVRGCCWPNLSS